MRNEYTVSEVVEIGEAQEVILGIKPGDEVSDSGTFRLQSENDLDE